MNGSFDCSTYVLCMWYAISLERGIASEVATKLNILSSKYRDDQIVNAHWDIVKLWKFAGPLFRQVLRASLISEYAVGIACSCLAGRLFEKINDLWMDPITYQMLPDTNWNSCQNSKKSPFSKHSDYSWDKTKLKSKEIQITYRWWCPKTLSLKKIYFLA